MEKEMKKGRYYVGAYDYVRKGYPVYFDNPARIFGFFIEEVNAEYIAKHMTDMLWKYRTTDVRKYKKDN